MRIIFLSIIFLALLSVCQSVCLSACLFICPSSFHVRFISFEPLVGLKNNAQMPSMMGQCVVCMFDQGQFVVKVIVQGLTLYYCMCPLYYLEELEFVTFLNNLNIKYNETMCRVHFFHNDFKVKVIF